MTDFKVSFDGVTDSERGTLSGNLFWEKKKYRVSTDKTFGKFINIEEFERALRAHIHNTEDKDTSNFLINPEEIYHDCNRSSISFCVKINY